MPALPAQMTVIAIRAPGGPDMLVPEQRPLPQPARRRGAGEGRCGGGQPARRHAAAGPLSAAAGRARHSGSRNRRRSRGARRRRQARGSWATRSWRWWSAEAMPNTAWRMKATASRCLPGSHWSKPPRSRKRSSRSGTTRSSVAACKAGETLLVHGGSSGIGTAAIQLAKAFGARVITTAGSAEKCEACRKLGADLAVNYKAEDFVAATKAAHRRQRRRRRSSTWSAATISSATTRPRRSTGASSRSPFRAAQGTVDFRRLMLKRLTHTGSTLRARSVADKAAIARGVEEQVLPLIAAGKVRPVIDSTFPLAQASAAHASMESEHSHRQDRAGGLSGRCLGVGALHSPCMPGPA